MDWLRRWLGDSRDLAAAKTEIARLNQSLVAHVTNAANLKALHAEQVGELRALVTIMMEPSQGVDCQKVRLRERVEAEKFARLVENQVGAAPGAMEGYRCPTCPRQPLSGEHFWHIRHVDPTQRGKKGRQYAKNRGRGLRTHVDPSVMARLKDSAGGVA